MKINWKVRVKSGPFWVGVVSACLVFVYALLGLFGIELPVAMDEVMRVFVLLLSALAAVGVVSDPTTPGMQDSERAMHYDIPGGK